MLLLTVAACNVIFPAVEEFVIMKVILKVTRIAVPVAKVDPNVLIAVIKLGAGAAVSVLPPKNASPEIVQPVGAAIANFKPVFEFALLEVPSMVT